MELLEGADLKEVLRTEGRLPLERATDYVIQAAEARPRRTPPAIVHARHEDRRQSFSVTKRADGTALIKVLNWDREGGIGDR